MSRYRRSQRSNDEILHGHRCDVEYQHRHSREYFFVNHPLILPLNPSSIDLQVLLEHIQDSCNKSTAIYSINPPLEPHSLKYCQESGRRYDTIYYIYERWFCDHSNLLDRGANAGTTLSKPQSTSKQPSKRSSISIKCGASMWSKLYRHALQTRTHKGWHSKIVGTIPSMGSSGSTSIRTCISSSGLCSGL